jgi:hypothetical protein
MDSILPMRERRLWERYTAPGTVATLTWLRGATEETIRGRLLQIGGGGVAFAAEEGPPQGTTVRLRVAPESHGSEQCEPVEARLVMVSQARSGDGVVLDLAWLGPCPIEFFELALYGSG